MNIPDLMLSYARDLPPKEMTHISPSYIGGCMRKHYYLIKGVKPTTPIEPKHKLNMQSGYFWEEIVKKSLEYARIPFIYQHKMVDEMLNLGGTSDILIHNIASSEWEVWDVKTESISAKNYRQGGYIESHDEYVHQINAYAILAIRSGMTVRRGGFIVVRRDDSTIEQFKYEFDIDKMKETMNRINQLKHCLENNVIPPCDGKFCKLGMCEYGNPKTRTTKNTECCGTLEEIERWTS